jgi:PleD family two-component response regulator
MTDQKRAEMALKTLAASDGLTGLANRRSVMHLRQNTHSDLLGFP